MRFTDILSQVAAFHDAFGTPNAAQPHAQLSPAEVDLRYCLMAEENDEYLDAARAGNVVEVADALGDQLYILAGTMLRHGMQDVIVKVFEEIQASNMSKLGQDGHPILREDGKILKGPNYFRPDIASILERHAKSQAWRDSALPEGTATASLDQLSWSVGGKIKAQDAAPQAAAPQAAAAKHATPHHATLHHGTSGDVSEPSHQTLRAEDWAEV